MTRRNRRRGDWGWQLVEPSPITAALGDLDRINLHHNLTPPKENSMPIPTPPPPLPEYVTRRELNETVDALTDMFTKALEEVTSIFEERLAQLPTTKADVADRCVRFLESHPGVKFPAYAIAENIGGVGGKEASAVLRRLAGAGRVSVDIQPQRHPLYFVKG